MGKSEIHLRNKEKTKYALVTTPAIFTQESLVTIINVTPFAQNSYTKENILVKQNELDDFIKTNKLDYHSKFYDDDFIIPEYMFINNKEHIIPVIKYFLNHTLLYDNSLSKIPKNSINVFMPFKKINQISMNDYKKCKKYHKEITYEGEIPTIKDVLSIINKQFLVRYYKEYEKNNHDVEELYKYISLNPHILDIYEDCFKKTCIRTYKMLKRHYGISCHNKITKDNFMTVDIFIKKFSYFCPYFTANEKNYHMYAKFIHFMHRAINKIVEDKLKIKII